MLSIVSVFREGSVAKAPHTKYFGHGQVCTAAEIPAPPPTLRPARQSRAMAAASFRSLSTWASSATS